MNNIPDFSAHGYEIIRPLGQNNLGGRTTWLARRTITVADLFQLRLTPNSSASVVLKQFEFATSGSTWSSYKAHEREIQALKRLNHPRIPKYLDSFETKSGFCLIQEYIDAPSLGTLLAERRVFNLREVAAIAASVLEVLIYLQSSGIHHRDIKPENILIDRALNAFLIDFGFAQNSAMMASVQSSFYGTLGFMAPEQQRGETTNASDLYSLGATLLCVLTNTSSAKVGSLINPKTQTFDLTRAKISKEFTVWLQGMVDPYPKNRYQNGRQALSALQAFLLGKKDLRRKSLWANIGAVLKSIFINRISIFIIFFITIFSLFYYILLVGQTETRRQEKFRQERTARAEEMLRTRKCRGCDLEGVSLVSKDLSKVDLEQANLKGADLSNAKLESTNLSKANLENATFKNSVIRNANLRQANLQKANFQDANIDGTEFTEANMSNAALQGINLEGENLQGVNLKGAYIGFAKLKGANLERANLEGAYMGFSDLRDVTMPNGTKHE